ncbi:MAG TPA: hypothetical protein VJZ69_00245 [Clostridia bacterium]|nr:hypothetical protein [Clostridia bacterium]
MIENIFSIITIVVVVAVFGFYFLIKKKEGKDSVYAVYFITVLLTGTALYALGLSYKQDADTTFSPLFLIARSFALSIKSFGGDFNASAFSKLAEANTLFAGAAVIHYFAAMVLTFLVVIKLFGKNAMNRLHVFINSRRAKYIVVGASGQAEIFFKSFDYKKKKRTTVILEAKQKDKKNELMFRGFAVVVIRDGEYEISKKRDKASKKNITRDTYGALKTAGFNRNKKDTKIIAMSESDEVNLLVAKIVTDRISDAIEPEKKSDGRIKTLSQEQETKLEAIKLSAHIMYIFIERTEHFAFIEYALGRVRFFNPFEVRARKFMLENPITSLIPKKWINTDKARLYNQAENGLGRPYRIGNIFIGFGVNNHQIFKKSICNYQLLDIDYNALIIDKDATRSEKQFRNAAPGLFDRYETVKDAKGNLVAKLISRGAELKPNPDGDIYYPSGEEKTNIVFADIDVLSEDFYKRIIAECESKDIVSVIISLGNDKLSVETALELRQKLYERELIKGKIGDAEYERVRIFVKIAKETVISDETLFNDKNDIDCEIKIFGADKEVLTENYIIQEELDFLAKRIANDYWKIAKGDAQTTNAVTKWDTLTDLKRESNRYSAMAIKTKLNLLGFDLRAGDGRIATSKEVASAYSTAYDLSLSYKQRVEKDTGKFVDFLERDDEGKIRDTARNNLARLEHQRWSIFHLVSGWTKLEIAKVTVISRQDEKAKQHACITTFEGLTDLREKQAALALTKAKESKKVLSEDTALSDADTVCYDFDVMDRLFGNLDKSKYAIEIQKEVSH